MCSLIQAPLTQPCRKRSYKEVGAWGPVGEVEIDLGNWERARAKAYGVVIKIEGVEAPSISISFEGAQTVIGVETLESIGLKLDPKTGRLEFTRPKGLAYFYEHILF